MSDDSETTMADIERPDDVTAKRVTGELKRAIENEDLSVEQSGFDDQSELLRAVEPVVRDYHEHYESIHLLDMFKTAWESDAHLSYSDAIGYQVDDDIVELVQRRETEVVSMLKGFDVTGTATWIMSYGSRYPTVGCLIEYVGAHRELENQGYLG